MSGAGNGSMLDTLAASAASDALSGGRGQQQAYQHAVSRRSGVGRDGSRTLVSTPLPASHGGGGGGSISGDEDLRAAVRVTPGRRLSGGSGYMQASSSALLDAGAAGGVCV